MTPDQARRLIDAAKGHRLEALVMVGMMLGLRPAELRGLVWSDIDFERGTLRVAGVEKDGKRIDEVKMSHEKAKRTLVMPDAIHQALVEHRERWELERSVAESWTAEDFVFVSTAGTPLNRNNLLRTLRTFSAEAGIGDDWNVYELRHTAASLLYNAGVPKERIADVLGHADTRMLDRVYLHPTRDALAHAASPMNDLFGP